MPTTLNTALCRFSIKNYHGTIRRQGKSPGLTAITYAMRKNSVWTQRKVTLGAFIVCFFIAGIPFWQIPYSNVTVPNAFFGFGTLVVFSMAAALAFRHGFGRGIVFPGLVFPAILMTRVIVEGFLDPTRHNLWPLALIITLLLGFAVAGPGAALGWLVSRLLR